MFVWVELDYWKLLSNAGELMIEAYRNGWLPSWPELNDAIAENLTSRDLFIAAAGPELMPTAGPTLNRVHYDSAAQKAGAVCQLFSRVGILPYSGLQTIERYARACEGLANLIESTHDAINTLQQPGTLPTRAPQDAKAPVLLADDKRDWFTVTHAAELLMKDIPELTLEKAKSRVSKAAGEKKFVTNGKGRARRIETISFKAWRLDQRDRDLDSDH